MSLSCTVLDIVHFLWAKCFNQRMMARSLSMEARSLSMGHPPSRLTQIPWSLACPRVDHTIRTMITITVDVVHTHIITTMTNITTLIHAGTEGLAHLITTTIACGDTGAAILRVMIAMILKMMIARTAMVDVCADPYLRPPQQTLHNLAYNRCHMLPLYPLPQSEVYNQPERANNPLGFPMNKKECTLLDASLGSQTRIIRSDDAMNQKARQCDEQEEPRRRRSDEEEEPRRRCSDEEFPDTEGPRRCPSDHTTYSSEPGDYERRPSILRTLDRTMETEALEPHIRTLLSPLCRLPLSDLVARWTMALFMLHPHRPNPVGTMVS